MVPTRRNSCTLDIMKKEIIRGILLTIFTFAVVLWTVVSVSAYLRTSNKLETPAVVLKQPPVQPDTNAPNATSTLISKNPQGSYSLYLHRAAYGSYGDKIVLRAVNLITKRETVVADFGVEHQYDTKIDPNTIVVNWLDELKFHYDSYDIELIDPKSLQEYFKNHEPRQSTDKYDLYTTQDNYLIIRVKKTGEIHLLDFENYRNLVTPKSDPYGVEAAPEWYDLIGADIIDSIDTLEVHIYDPINYQAQNESSIVVWSNIDGSNMREVYYEGGRNTGEPLSVSPSGKYFFSTSFWHMSIAETAYSVDVVSIASTTESIDLLGIIGRGIELTMPTTRRTVGASWQRDSVLEFVVDYTPPESTQLIYRTETWQVDLDTRKATMIKSQDFPGGKDMTAG